MKEERILIVEDNQIIAAGIKKTLMQDGFIVFGPLQKGEEVLDWLKDNPVDLVVLDILLKGERTGIDVAKQIRETADLPIVFLSGLQDRETLEKIFSLGPTAYLSKPYKEVDLIAAVELALKKGIEIAEPEPAEETANLATNNTVFVRKGGYFVRISFDSILWIEAHRNYTEIITIEGKYLLTLPMGTVLERISFSNLVRIHRSYAININHINAFNEKEVLINGEKIPIGRLYLDVLNKQLFKI